MLKSQIFIIIIGICAAILIFNLPKVIIQDQKQLASEQGEKEHDGPHPPDLGEVHHVSVSGSDSISLAALTNNYFTVSDKEKKLIFADSLVGKYKALHQYDSVARYSGEIAGLKPSEKNLVKAGDAYYETSTLMQSEGNAEYNQKARYYYQKVLDKSPGNLEVKSKLAMTYVGGEETMKGVKILREVLEADPKNEQALYNIGILSLQSGQYSKAINRFEELVTINPANANAQFYLGVSYMNAGKKEKAKEHIEIAKGLEKDPAFQSTVDSYLKDINK